MGVYDRDYYREETEERGISLGNRSMVINLIIVNVAMYLADIFLAGRDHWLTLDYLAISADTLVKPWLWYQFLTCGFAHDPSQNWHIIGNMLGLWMFGRPVEDHYGPKEFLRFYLAALLFGSVSWCVLQYFLAVPIVGPDGIAHWPRMLGASGAVTAVVMLFIFHYPKQTVLLFFVLPVPAWVLGVLIVAGNLFALQGPGVAYEVHLAGCLFAFCYYRFHWRLSSRWPSRRRSWGRSALRPRTSLRVHEPDDEVGEHDDDEADRILEKVNREGLDSLTPKERRTLEEYSRRMRQKHR